jgi:DNA-binding MltR family transcriptional regulator
MPKLQVLDIADWNDTVGAYHGESDRGAAVLAGSFAEHVLGAYLLHVVADKSIGEKLFGATGALSSFSQRIAIAYAFKLISREEYLDYERLRQVRNYFAHHPLDATFSSKEVQKYISQLQIFSARPKDTSETKQTQHRIAYLLACGILSTQLIGKIETNVRTKN